jgi:uncharacterized protein (DUF305 family)
MKTHETHQQHTQRTSNYRKLTIMVLLSFIAMYAFMYAMVDSFDNVIHNVNQIYMAIVMTMAMVNIELAIMWDMYKYKKLNLAIMIASIVLLVASFLFIRKQTGVTDKQFLKSMIPHHAAAILMVQETDLTDPEIQKLANDIITAQQREIEFMKTKLKQIDNK